MMSLGSQGATGPESRYGSYGSTLDALSGLMGITGYEGSHPFWSGGEVNYPDQVASVYGAGLLLAALRHKQRTGQGTYIDLSQREMVTTMIGEHVVEYTAGGHPPELRGNQRPEYAPNDAFRCDGPNDWVAISVANDDEWRRLCEAIGRSELATDERFETHLARRHNAEALRPEIEAWSRPRSKHEAMAVLQAAGVRAAAVLNGAEMLEDPHLNARGYYQPIENSRGAQQTLRIAPYHLSATPTEVRRPAPLLGEHTEYVLREIIGLSEAELAELAEEDVTRNAPAGRRGRAR